MYAQEGAYTPGSAAQLLQLACIVNNNSHGVGAAQAGNRDVAFAMFPALSMLNHSCRPNCVYANRGAVTISTSTHAAEIAASCGSSSSQQQQQQQQQQQHRAIRRWYQHASAWSHHQSCPCELKRKPTQTE